MQSFGCAGWPDTDHAGAQGDSQVLGAALYDFAFAVCVFGLRVGGRGGLLTEALATQSLG
jgi:hypothetical protein